MLLFGGCKCMNRVPVAVVLQMARDLRMLPVALLCMMASLLSLEVSDDVHEKRAPGCF